MTLDKKDAVIKEMVILMFTIISFNMKAAVLRDPAVFLAVDIKKVVHASSFLESLEYNEWKRYLGERYQC